MRTPWSRRAGALLLALWLSVSLAEQAAADHCPVHDPLGAAMAAMAHPAEHGADAHHREGGAHHCSCLERCCGASAMLVPTATRHAARSRAIPAAPAARRADATPPARTGTRLPFANGPPHAHAA